MPHSRAPERQHIPNPNYQMPPNPSPPTYGSPATHGSSQPYAPFSDASHRSRDPFLPPAHAQRHDPWERTNGERYATAPNGERLNGHGRPGWPAPAPANDSSSSSTITAAPINTTPTAHPAPVAAHYRARSQPSAHQTHPQHPPYNPAHSPPAASPHTNGTAHMYGYGSAQRASHADGSQQNYHPGPPVDGHHAPPPPPQLPPFGARHMPPPSPPQGQPLPFGAPGPPPPPQFPSGRDLPAIRSGSGMSISSILGGSSAGTPRRTPPPGSASSPPAKSMRPPSPRGSTYGGARADYGSWRRPLTPERAGPIGSALGDHRPYTAGSATSPDYAHPPSSLHRYTSSHPAMPPSGDARTTGYWRSDGPPPRPNSQPATAQGLPPPPPLVHESSDPSRHRPAYYSASAAEQRRADEEQQRVRSISDPRAGERDRPGTAQPVPGAAYNSSVDQRYPGVQYSPGGYPGYGPDNAPRENGSGLEDRPPYPTYGPPPVYGPAPGPQAASPTHNGVGLGGPRDYRRSPEPSYRGASEPFRSVNQLNGLDRRSDVYQGSMSEVPPRAHPYDMPNARMGEELQHQRLLTNISPETFRRQLGRASPLPQAVQGASAQMKGPGGDPNIKSEFGRMFSGLGSGYGGGAVTPSRGSPMPQGRPDGAEFGSGELDSLQMVRSGSRGVKGRRRFKEEDGRAYSEYGDRAGTPSGSKRAKHSHTPGAHHHHPHIVHHHHHKPEDDNNLPQARSATPTAFANRLASVGQNAGPQTAGSTPHHHHHYPPHHHSHAHGHAHHHHPAGSVKQQTPVPVAPPVMQKRNTIINSQTVLQSVTDKPRSHLGSQLYKVKYELPPRSSSITVLSNVPGPLGISDRFGYTMRPLPIPKFDASRAGCTFTVRVPRLYLTTEKREEICRHRFLWGTDVYSDDSDPIAAAIHSGWIQGAWTREIDMSLLESSGNNEPTSNGNANGNGKTVKSESAPATATTEIPTSMDAPPPTGPVPPPVETDCHITLLILPQLTRYSASTRHGVRSRAWTEPHDGLSYQVVKVEWVDEGAFGGSAMAERGGAARRRRLELKAKERSSVLQAISAGGRRRHDASEELKRRKVNGNAVGGGFAEGRAVVEAVG